MSHPRIEEVSDSDDAASDPSEGDIDEFDDADIIQRVDAHQKQQQATAAAAVRQQKQAQAQAQPPRPNPAAHPHPHGGEMGIAHDQSAYAGFQCLYPIYFDAARTRAEGRRVSRSAAVESPLAREIAQACGNLRLQALFEPTKTHPRDWANPGRVRVLLRGPNGARPAGVKNKHHLYLLVSEHLRANPTTEDCAGLRAVAVPGLPPPAADAPWPRPAVPRGWKVGGLLPHYSPALTGGGVSENFLKDMMREMQGAGAGGGPGGLDMASMLAAVTSGGGGGGGGGGSGAGEEKKSKKKGKK
ncbi:hypothetical protein RB595_005135 [Gaeumannomyces hyphopodioides]